MQKKLYNIELNEGIQREQKIFLKIPILFFSKKIILTAFFRLKIALF